MNFSRKLFAIGAALGVALMASSCTTTYDHYGRPVQTVDPGVAIAGVAAAGLLGYALANDDDDHHRHHRHHRRHDHHYGHYGHWY